MSTTFSSGPAPLGERLLVETVEGEYLFARRVLPGLMSPKPKGNTLVAFCWINEMSVPLKVEVKRWATTVSLDATA